VHVYNFALKFQTTAEKTAKNLGGYFFATPCTPTKYDPCQKTKKVTISLWPMQ